jgi:hypothetical protein
MEKFGSGNQDEHPGSAILIRNRAVNISHAQCTLGKRLPTRSSYSVSLALYCTCVNVHLLPIIRSVSPPTLTTDLARQSVYYFRSRLILYRTLARYLRTRM